MLPSRYIQRNSVINEIYCESLFERGGVLVSKTYADVFYENPVWNQDSEDHLMHCKYVEFEDVKDCGHAFGDVKKCSKCWEEPILNID